MPRELALLICIFFTFFLFWVDRKKSDGPSKALWIPLLWMFFAGTREFSQWFDLGGQGHDPAAYLAGNPIDLAFQLLLILIGVVILSRRRLNWGQLLNQNSLIWLYFLFGLASLLWSDYPFVSFKRWSKAMGNLVMALVILTEKRPYEAFGDVLRRFAFLVIPFSVLLCRFYPEIGRASIHRGTFLYTGMALGKNGLGQLCLLSGIYFLWNLFQGSRHEIKFGGYPHRLLSFLFLSMIAWLLNKANSATSVACLIIMLSIFLLSRMHAVACEPKRILTIGIVWVTLVGLLEMTFDVSELALSFLNRKPDLTTRVPMWRELLNMGSNPIVGVGYESFWLGDRMSYLWGKFESFVQSHNGYLETYLNLGLIGLFLILASICSGLIKVRKHLTIDYPAAVMRLSVIVIVALYNWTEATFYGASNMWILFLVAIIDISIQKSGNQPVLQA